MTDTLYRDKGCKGVELSSEAAAQYMAMKLFRDSLPRGRKNLYDHIARMNMFVNKENFDLETLRFPRYEPKKSCDTVACVCGWLPDTFPSIFGDEKAGSIYNPEDLNYFFGLRFHEWDYLFCGHFYPDEAINDFNMVRLRIMHFIKNEGLNFHFKARESRLSLIPERFLK